MGYKKKGGFVMPPGDFPLGDGASVQGMRNDRCSKETEGMHSVLQDSNPPNSVHNMYMMGEGGAPGRHPFMMVPMPEHSSQGLRGPHTMQMGEGGCQGRCPNPNAYMCEGGRGGRGLPAAMHETGGQGAAMMMPPEEGGSQGGARGPPMMHMGEVVQGSRGPPGSSQGGRGPPMMPMAEGSGQGLRGPAMGAMLDEGGGQQGGRGMHMMMPTGEGSGHGGRGPPMMLPMGAEGGRSPPMMMGIGEANAQGGRGRVMMHSRDGACQGGRGGSAVMPPTYEGGCPGNRGGGGSANYNSHMMRAMAEGGSCQGLRGGPPNMMGMGEGGSQSNLIMSLEESGGVGSLRDLSMMAMSEGGGGGNCGLAMMPPPMGEGSGRAGNNRLQAQIAQAQIAQQMGQQQRMGGQQQPVSRMGGSVNGMNDGRGGGGGGPGAQGPGSQGMACLPRGMGPQCAMGMQGGMAMSPPGGPGGPQGGVGGPQGGMVGLQGCQGPHGGCPGQQGGNPLGAQGGALGTQGCPLSAQGNAAHQGVMGPQGGQGGQCGQGVVGSQGGMHAQGGLSAQAGVPPCQAPASVPDSQALLQMAHELGLMSGSQPTTTAPALTSGRQSRSSLASNSCEGSGRGRLYAARGVHFGEAVAERAEARSASDGQSPQPPATAVSGGSTAKATVLSDQLVCELELISPSLPAQRAALIEEVLGQVLLTCRACARSSGGPPSDAGTDVDQLLPLGAYHLGVMMPEDEVDVVYVAPLHVQLADFASVLRYQLEQTAEVRAMSPTGPDGVLAAPGLSFVMRGVSIKLLLSQDIPGMPWPQPESITQNNAGLLAREASEKILASAPNVKQFRNLLRFVRHWARQRGIHGHYLGFLSGTAWAICCARICQSHTEELSQLVARFFQTLSRWDWRQPVSLLPANSAAPAADTAAQTAGAGGPDGPALATVGVLLPLAVQVPIPATVFVTETTSKIMQKELRRGYKMVQSVTWARPHWTDVYAMARFFQRHRHYLEFNFMASSETVFAAWLTWGRQQMQDLVHLFESTSSNLVTLRPWPDWIAFKDASWPHARAVFVGLHLKRGTDTGSQGAHRSFDLREPIVKFLEAIGAWPEAERYSNQFELLIRHVRLAELEQWLDNQHRGLVANSASQTPQDNVHSWQCSASVASANWSITEDVDTALQDE